MVKKAIILRNFISTYTINQLNRWTLDNCHQWFFQDACMDPYNQRTRFTTRFPNDAIDVPKLNYPVSAFVLKKRIIDHFNLHEYKSPPSYSHGIVNGIGYENGMIENHIDPVYYENTKTIHFNAITQPADYGGHTIINGVKYDNVNPNDLLIYQVSEVYHEVTETKGDTPRILWVFGFCLDDKKIEEIFL